MRRVALIVALVFAAAACSHAQPQSPATLQLANPGRCVPVDVVAAPESASLLKPVASRFNGSEAARLAHGDCAFVRVRTLQSSLAADHLVAGWRDRVSLGPPPAIWAPEAGAWIALANERLRLAHDAPLVTRATSIARSPLVVAMPAPLARALGWPRAKVGWGTLAGLAANPRGWAAIGHPEWGRFRLGRTNPHQSTTGLLASIALTRRGDLPAARALEASVIYYGDLDWTYLDNWLRLDKKGAPTARYASAVVTTERAVIAYNTGNASGVVRPASRAKPPRTRLVAITPSDGPAVSDYPVAPIERTWVSAGAQAGARAFVAFARTAITPSKLAAAGLRPALAAGTATLTSTPTVTSALDEWARIHKRARVLLLFDVSDSMGDNSDPRNPNSPSKITLAKSALAAALGELAADDEVGLRTFTTGVHGSASPYWTDVVPIGPYARRRAALLHAIAGLAPQKGSPLYAATRGAFDTMTAGADLGRINAVVLLTDGYNEDEKHNDRSALLAHLNDSVRLFTISYSGQADLSTLRRIAQATNARVYDATDPTLVDDSYRAALANF